MRCEPARHHPNGFTLIELLIALGILGVLAAVALQNIFGALPQYRLNGATREVFGELMTARMKAVSLNRRVKVFFPDNRQYKICDDANNDNTVDDCEGSARIKDIQAAYSGVTLSANINPVFQPRGTASMATITVSNSHGSKSITIAITGRVKIN